MARPRLGAALSAASLVVSVAWAVLWVRSYVRADVLAYVARPAPERFWRLEVAPVVGLFSGDLSVVELDLTDLAEMPWELADLGWHAGTRRYARGEVRERMPARRLFRLLDFSLDHEPRIDGLSDDGPALRWERWSLAVPYWALVLGFAGPFLWRTRRRRLAARPAAAGTAVPSDPKPE